MRRGREQIAALMAGFVAIGVVGTIGYMILEGWDPVESLYMTVITLTTVGFGEVHPLSRPGQVFTTGLIILGVGLVAYSATVVGQFLLDGTLARIVRRRRMQKRIGELHDHYIICGCGRTGAEVVAFLRERKIPFVVVDFNSEVIARLEAQRIPVIEGNAHDNETLEMAGIEKARALIATAASDAENVFITLTARSMREEIQIACRCEETASEPKLRRAGANRVINPHAIAGRHLIASVHRPGVFEFLESTAAIGGATDFQEFEIEPEAGVVGRTIGQLDVGRNHRVSILAIRRHDGLVVPNPGADTEISPHDSILVLGRIEDLDHFRGMLEEPA